MINLHNIDCMEFMRNVPDKYYDLAIVDPPYGIGNFVRTTSRGKKINRPTVKWNEHTPNHEYFTELLRVSDNQIIWGANYYNCFNTGGSIVWYKNMGHPDFSQCEIASNSLKRTVDFFNYTWAVNRHSIEDIIHQCQKPIALYKWLLHNYANPGDKILDTHGGSMSIAIACHDYGFDLDLCELDPDYYAAGVKRYNNHIKQLSLL